MPTPDPIPTNTELNLLATVLADPTDAVAREVYADFLQEKGESRAADETRVRGEAQAIRDGTAPPTFEQLLALAPAPDWASRREWCSRQEELLKRVIWAAFSDRARLTPSTKELRLEVDGEAVGVEVYWRAPVTERVTYRIWSFRTSSKLMVRGKRGWNVKTVVAEAMKQLGTGRTRREIDTARKDRDKRLGGAIGKLMGQFHLKPYLVTPAQSGERLRITLERDPEEMERLVRMLAENDLLTPEDQAPQLPPPPAE